MRQFAFIQARVSPDELQRDALALCSELPFDVSVNLLDVAEFIGAVHIVGVTVYRRRTVAGPQSA